MNFFLTNCSFPFNLYFFEFHLKIKKIVSDVLCLSKVETWKSFIWRPNPKAKRQQIISHIFNPPICLVCLSISINYSSLCAVNSTSRDADQKPKATPHLISSPLSPSTFSTHIQTRIMRWRRLREPPPPGKASTSGCVSSNRPGTQRSTSASAITDGSSGSLCLSISWALT